MRTREAQDLRRLLWPVALEGVCGAIIVSLVFVALGFLHPALALPLIGLGIFGALTRPARVRDPGAIPPSKTADSSGEAASSA
jgi:uncharacterized membrane protein